MTHTSSSLLQYFLSFPLSPSGICLRRLKWEKWKPNAAKINERVHRLIRWPKVRGKWPATAGGIEAWAKLIHAHVSLLRSLSSYMHLLSCTRCRGSPLFGLLFCYSESTSVVPIRPLLFILSSEPIPPNSPYDAGMSVRTWSQARSYTHDTQLAQLACTWCIRSASSAEASAFGCTRPRNFNSVAARAIKSTNSADISARNYQFREAKSYEESLSGISITVQSPNPALLFLFSKHDFISCCF